MFGVVFFWVRGGGGVSSNTKTRAVSSSTHARAHKKTNALVVGGVERGVPRAQLAVAQVVGVGEAPLAACVVVAPVVALAREVEPLGVPKLVALD